MWNLHFLEGRQEPNFKFLRRNWWKDCCQPSLTNSSGKSFHKAFLSSFLLLVNRLKKRESFGLESDMAREEPVLQNTVVAVQKNCDRVWVFETARDIGVFNPYLLSLHAAASISLHSHVFLKEGCFKRFFRSRQQPPSPPQMLSFGSFVSSLSLFQRSFSPFRGLAHALRTRLSWQASFVAALKQQPSGKRKKQS